MILLIDNYDSFVHTLARYLQELGCETVVVRNDAVSPAEVLAMKPQAIVLSPGPCTPNEAGISMEIVRQCAPAIPLLGVCLGHQAIAAAWGGNVVRAGQPMHGMTSLVEHHGSALFAGMESPFAATRYHSLVVEEQSLPQQLSVSARTNDGVIMAIEHQTYRTYGIQFHPESVLTQHGHRLLANFLTLAGIDGAGTIPGGDRPATSMDADDFYQRAVEPEAVRPL